MAVIFWQKYSVYFWRFWGVNGLVSMDWFLYDNGLRHERVKNLSACSIQWRQICIMLNRKFLKLFLKLVKGSNLCVTGAKFLSVILVNSEAWQQWYFLCINFKQLSQAYSEPNQTSQMALFAKKSQWLHSWTIFG